MSTEVENMDNSQHDAKLLVMGCLESEIQKLHYQSRDWMRTYLLELLTEAEQKDDNLAKSLVSALERYLDK